MQLHFEPLLCFSIVKLKCLPSLTCSFLPVLTVPKGKGSQSESFHFTDVRTEEQGVSQWVRVSVRWQETGTEETEIIPESTLGLLVYLLASCNYNNNLASPDIALWYNRRNAPLPVRGAEQGYRSLESVRTGTLSSPLPWVPLHLHASVPT